MILAGFKNPGSMETFASGLKKRIAPSSPEIHERRPPRYRVRHPPEVWGQVIQGLDRDCPARDEAAIPSFPGNIHHHCIRRRLNQILDRLRVAGEIKDLACLCEVRDRLTGIFPAIRIEIDEYVIKDDRHRK